MAEHDDMDPNTPVTRAELREELRQELAKHPTRVELEKVLETLATKADLERFATKADLERFATKLDLERFEARFREFEARLFAELARHSLASRESMSTEVAVVDDKYKDLPERVTRLEAAVFKPRRRARRG